MPLSGKHIVIGISGGIAAYKIPSLIRLCVKAGAEVKTIATKNALQFVTSLTLETLSGNKVYSDVFDSGNDHSIEHVSLSDWADLLVVAPATADIIGKFANGIADDALSTQFLACASPVIVAPAMNHNMLHHPATQRNLATLSSFPNVKVMDTCHGELACRQDGDGRMAEPEDIFSAIKQALTPQDLTGKKVLITAGPTQEMIDPVRYISNCSTGKMGYALADECAMRGAEVTLVSGPTALSINRHNINRIDVVSAQDMYNAATAFFEKSDIVILCAAVADFRPETIATQKIKRENQNGEYKIKTSQLNLISTPDIAAELGKRKKGQTIIGFALETNNETANAQDKMQRKNFDYIVLNSLRNTGAGFGYNTNQITIFGKDGSKKDFPLLPKQEVAKNIINYVLKTC